MNALMCCRIKAADVAKIFVAIIVVIVVAVIVISYRIINKMPDDHVQSSKNIVFKDNTDEGTR